jgi:serine protease
MHSSKLSSWLLLLSCLSLNGAIALGADTNPIAASRTPSTTSAETGVQNLIVKFREGSATNAGAGKADPLAAASTHKLRASTAVRRAGLVLVDSREIADGMQAIKVHTTSSRDTLGSTLARLRADPTVEYAEPDYRRRVHAVPNDPIFQSSQWHLKNAASTPSAIDAVGAWDVTQGADDLVVAVIDTGVRFDHPDLKRVTAGGRLLDGYDFISDATRANDGNGRDADASDPGDSCQGSDSSWHGTRVSGIVGALTDNAIGVAGITWRGRILPVRGIGNCDGTDSDLIQAMLWSAGVPVSGVPDNPTPAKLINMSFGSGGSCPASWRDAISQVVARGTLLVVSAGNEGGPVNSPANCPGVAAVAGIRHAGTKVGFSSLGREIALSAPGGNCVNQTGPCLYSIDTTTNAGTTSPGANTYTDQNHFNVGTSFSAPIVAGIAALMAAVNARLEPGELILRLQAGTEPFSRSSDPTIPDCHVPTGAGDLQDSECNCTTATCGAGMANARGAVVEALRPVAVATASPPTAATGQTVSLDGSGSSASTGRSIVAYAWTVVTSTGPAPVIANANTPSASFTTTDTGALTVRLTVTDDQGAQDSADVSVNGTAPVVAVTVSPGTASVSAGGGTQAFSATVANTSNTAVTWQVNGITGGNATVGTISASGLYTAPATVPSPSTVTVRAISNADNTRFGSAQVTVTATPTTGGGGGGGAIDAVWLLAGVIRLLHLSRLGGRGRAQRG